MADEPNAPEAATPTKTVMPSTVHELRTGKKPEQVIPPGTLLTDQLLRDHKIDDKTVDALIGTGAIDLVEVLKG